LLVTEAQFLWFNLSASLDERTPSGVRAGGKQEPSGAKNISFPHMSAGGQRALQGYAIGNSNILWESLPLLWLRRKIGKSIAPEKYEARFKGKAALNAWSNLL
jgi:hypothetical protein